MSINNKKLSNGVHPVKSREAGAANPQFNGVNTPKILVVDDQFSDRELVKDILEREDFIVKTVSSGKEAMEELSKEQYDVILSDLMMPEIDGLQLVKLVKENNYDTEIIVMTAYATAQTAAQSIKLGAYDYLTKPIDRHKISIVLKNCIEAHRHAKEVKILQQKLFNMEKMSTIAQFSAGIAHQLRNPLFAILTTATYLSEKYAHENDLVNSLNLIIRNCEQSDKIIHSLLTTTDFNEIKLESIPLNETVLQTIKLVQPQLEVKNIKLVTELIKNEIYVLGNYSYLQQCFLNVIMNSVDAIDQSQENGIIKISTFFKETSLPTRRVQDITNKFGCIEFEDNGQGIPDELITKVFDPFFTLKPNGTGMGLFFVYQIIVNCFGGDIRIESVKGRGTKVAILLCSDKT